MDAGSVFFFLLTLKCHYSVSCFSLFLLSSTDKPPPSLSKWEKAESVGLYNSMFNQPAFEIRTALEDYADRLDEMKANPCFIAKRRMFACWRLRLLRSHLYNITLECRRWRGLRNLGGPEISSSASVLKPWHSSARSLINFNVQIPSKVTHGQQRDQKQTAELQIKHSGGDSQCYDHGHRCHAETGTSAFNFDTSKGQWEAM